MTRRKFLKIAAIAAASSAGTAGIAHAAPRRVRLTRHRIPWPARARLRVAHLTDLHVGWGTPERLLEQGIRLCVRARPDLVVLTGDYVNRTLDHLTEMQRLVARLPRPCVATLGNHDHWSGADAVAAALQREGIVVLRNENIRIRIGHQRVPIVGVDDAFTRHHDIDRAFSGLSCPETALVLSHFPDAAEQIASCGARVVLSGHTHGGQVEIPIVTRAIARLAGNKYLAGWYRLGCTRLFVNAGIGSAAIRFRVGHRAQPEVAIIDLEPS